MCTVRRFIHFFSAVVLFTHFAPFYLNSNPHNVRHHAFIKDQIHKLQQKVDFYTKLHKKENRLPLMECKGMLLEPGKTDPSVPALRDSLYALGDLSTTSYESDRNTYGNILEAAVKKFQSRHFLEMDGVFGPKTCRALTNDPQTLIARLKLNITRLETLQKSLPDDAIVANVAIYRLFGIRKQKTEINMKVIGGRPYRRTPLMETDMTKLVFNPTWTVPRSIIFRSKLNKIQKDVNFLQEKNFHLYDHDGNRVNPEEINWNQVGRHYFPYRLRQTPGTHNALGPIKFHIINNQAIYLHGTNQPELFGEESRALSSGCVRVEDPFLLAEWLLHNFHEDFDTQEAALKAVKSKMKAGKTRHFPLSTPVHTHLVYISTWVDDNGTFWVSDDPYDYDKVALQKIAAAQTVKAQ